jgi:RNA polymerase sigma-70 factor (ECF subfamily)
VFRYLARRAGPLVAEDLLSEVFTAALNARKRVVAHRSGSALPWLYGIAMNVLRRYFRHRQPSRAADPDLVMDWDAVDARLDAEAQRRRLRSALRTLSSSDRELLLLVAWEGLTSAEAAAVLGISKVTARSRLHRARHRAQQAMQANADLPVLTVQPTRGEAS